MKMCRAITIPFFIVFAMAFNGVMASKVLIAGYLTPAPPEVIAPTGAPKPVVGGIKIRYAGQVNYTNSDGYFSFEKAHSSNTLRIIVTRTTSYDTLKNTVSHQTLSEEKPAMAVYTLEKKSGSPETIPALANTPAPTEEVTPHDDDSKMWYWQLTFDGNELSKSALSSRDMIIEAEPADIYIQSGGTRPAVENNQHIIPHATIMVLRTPAVPRIELSDRFNQDIDTEKQTDRSENSDAPPVLRAIF